MTDEPTIKVGSRWRNKKIQSFGLVRVEGFTWNCVILRHESGRSISKERDYFLEDYEPATPDTAGAVASVTDADIRVAALAWDTTVADLETAEAYGVDRTQIQKSVALIRDRASKLRALIGAYRDQH